jgi:uncharacterized protein Yka (UPF0111/DUF47 family)
MKIRRSNVMYKYTNEELKEALKEVSSTINKCEKMQGKFEEGTSQYSLLRNRIKAMYISKLLIVNELSKTKQTLVNQAGEVTQKLEPDIKNAMVHYTKEELKEALRPVVSVISKCEKAQGKFVEGTTHHRRFKNIINAMYISKSFIENQLSIME